MGKYKWYEYLRHAIKCFWGLHNWMDWEPDINAKYDIRFCFHCGKRERGKVI